MTPQRKNVHFSDKNGIVMILEQYELPDPIYITSDIASTNSSIDVVARSEQLSPIDKKKSFSQFFRKLIEKIKKLFNKK